MKITESLDGLGRPVSYYPRLARCLGSVPAALFLAQLWYWRDKQTHEYLYKTAAELEAELGLSAKAQRTARAILTKLGILREMYARLQHEMHFIVDADRLNAVWAAWEKRESMRRKGLSRTARPSLRETTEGHFPNRPRGASIPETTHRLPATEYAMNPPSPHPPPRGRAVLDKLAHTHERPEGTEDVGAVAPARVAL